MTSVRTAPHLGQACPSMPSAPLYALNVLPRRRERLLARRADALGGTICLRASSSSFFSVVVNRPMARSLRYSWAHDRGQATVLRNVATRARGSSSPPGRPRSSPTAPTSAVGVPDEDAQALSEMLQTLASTRNRDNAREVGGDRPRARGSCATTPDDFGVCEDCGDEIADKRLRRDAVRALLRRVSGGGRSQAQRRAQERHRLQVAFSRFRDGGSSGGRTRSLSPPCACDG